MKLTIAEHATLSNEQLRRRGATNQEIEALRAEQWPNAKKSEIKANVAKPAPVMPTEPTVEQK